MADVRLIDANALKAKLYSLLKIEEAPPMFIEGLETALAVADVAPTIDAVPVVHGRWVKANGMMPPEYHGRKCCSVCDAFALSDFYGRERLSDFCPNCGAKMDGGADNV